LIAIIVTHHAINATNDATIVAIHATIAALIAIIVAHHAINATNDATIVSTHATIAITLDQEGAIALNSTFKPLPTPQPN
jgi:hypothetical protein